MPEIIAVACAKGGAAKTATVSNLGVALAEGGERILVIDLDRNCALTHQLGHGSSSQEEGVCGVMRQAAEFEEAIKPVRDSQTGAKINNLDLLAGSVHLRGLEIALAGQSFREEILMRALAAGDEIYDRILIDCPANNGLLTLNGLVAADEVIIPVNMGDAETLQGALEIAASVRELDAMGRHVAIKMVLPTHADPRRRVYKRMTMDLKSLGQPVCPIEIPLSAEFETATAARQPLFVRKPYHQGALRYLELAQEIRTVGVAA